MAGQQRAFFMPTVYTLAQNLGSSVPNQQHIAKKS